MSTRRPPGTGQLFVKHGAWYGRWRTPDGRRLSRPVGPARTPGEHEVAMVNDAVTVDESAPRINDPRLPGL